MIIFFTFLFVKKESSSDTTVMQQADKRNAMHILLSNHSATN